MDIDDIGRGQTFGQSPKTLTAERIEQLLEGELEGDDHPHQPTRRSLTERLATLRHEQARREQANEMTAQEIVDSIPREFR